MPSYLYATNPEPGQRIITGRHHPLGVKSKWQTKVVLQKNSSLSMNVFETKWNSSDLVAKAIPTLLSRTRQLIASSASSASQDVANSVTLSQAAQHSLSSRTQSTFSSNTLVGISNIHSDGCPATVLVTSKRLLPVSIRGA